MLSAREFLDVLRCQRGHRVEDGVYPMVQCDFAYHSNRIEGNRLSAEQTRMLFDERAVSVGQARQDDIRETTNHFQAFDLILDCWDEGLSAGLLFALHRTLKAGTAQAEDPRCSVGGYKRCETVIGSLELATTPPEQVAEAVDRLLSGYERQSGQHDLDDLLAFHVQFERIHPFSDGNGRIGRLLLFKECLRSGLTPFFIPYDLRDYYFRGLRMFGRERGWLRDTCLTAQDRFAAQYMPPAAAFFQRMEATRADRPGSAGAGARRECGAEPQMGRERER